MNSTDNVYLSLPVVDELYFVADLAYVSSVLRLAIFNSKTV